MILDLFHQAYYINLKQRPDRQAHIRSQLARSGLAGQVKRFEGITVDQRGRFYKRGARGNWLSHVAIWRHALRQGGGHLLVMEDDATFAPDFVQRFPECRRQLPADWDFLYAQGWSWEGELTGEAGLQKVPYTMLTHFYGISSRMLPRLLERCDENKSMAIDAWLIEHVHPGSEVYCSFPALAWQSGSPSELSLEEYEGSFGFKGDRTIAGWARNMDTPRKPVRLDILVRGKLFDTVLADEYRADLAAVGMVWGKFGFTCKLAAPLDAADRERVRVRVRDSDFELPAHGI